MVKCHFQINSGDPVSVAHVLKAILLDIGIIYINSVSLSLTHTHTHTNTVLIFKKCEKDKLADVKGTKVSLAYFFYQLVNSSFIL